MENGIQIVLTWQSILGAAAIIGAVVAIVNYLRKLFGWFDQIKDRHERLDSTDDQYKDYHYQKRV